jgi:hypothetical protein
MTQMVQGFKKLSDIHKDKHSCQPSTSTMEVNASEVQEAILENWHFTFSDLPTALQLSIENKHKTVHEELDTEKCVDADYQDVRLKSTIISVSRLLLHTFNGFKTKKMGYWNPWWQAMRCVYTM